MNQYGNGETRATLKSTFGSRGNLRGYILKVVSYRLSGGTYEGIFKFSIFFKKIGMPELL